MNRRKFLQWLGGMAAAVGLPALPQPDPRPEFSIDLRDFAPTDSAFHDGGFTVTSFIVDPQNAPRVMLIRSGGAERNCR
jgi:hypothetical protein